VRFTRLQGELADGSLWGFMQFIDEQTPGKMYTITDADQPVISAPYPPNETQPVKLPLRMALSRLVSDVITGEVIPDHWMIITSLVRSDELALTFHTTRHTLPWQMVGIDMPLREALCWLQGLHG
jgi:hypothetical protein